MGQKKDLINTACSQHGKEAVDPKNWNTKKNKPHTQINTNTFKHIIAEP